MQQGINAWERLCGRKMLALESGLLGAEFRACERELGPGVEDFARLSQRNLVLVGVAFRMASDCMKHG